MFRGLWSGEKAFAGPFAITIDVTRRCNLRCIGCSTHSPDRTTPAPSDATVSDVDVELVAKLCREMQHVGTRKLVFCGQGEPLLHPRLPELIQIAKAAGLNTMLITNGTLLDEPAAGAFVESGLDLLRVSLWGTSRQALESNYPGTRAEYVQAVPAAIRRLIAVREVRGSRLPRVGLHLIIDRHSVADIESFVELAQDVGVDAVSFSPLHTLRGLQSRLGLSRDEERAVILLLRQVGRKLRSVGLENNIEETIRRYNAGPDVLRTVACYTPWTHPRVRVDGTVVPCDACDWPVGNLYAQSLSEIWNGSAYRSFRTHIASPSGSAAIDGRCDCSYCCHFGSNEKIHRVYRWVAPAARVFRS